MVNDLANFFGAVASGGGPIDDTGGGTVQLLYYFDEPNTQIVDEIAGVTCAEMGVSPTYGVTIGSGPFLSESPGVQYDTSNGGHRKTTATSEADISTDSVIEMSLEMFSGAGTVTQAIMSTYDSGGTEGYQLWYRNDTEQIFFSQASSGGSIGAIAFNASVPNSLVLDTGPFKMRVTIDKDNEAALFINGSAYGVVDISIVSAVTFAASRLTFGIGNATANPLNGVIYQYRLTTGTLTANYGPAGVD